MGGLPASLFLQSPGTHPRHTFNRRETMTPRTDTGGPTGMSRSRATKRCSFFSGVEKTPESARSANPAGSVFQVSTSQDKTDRGFLEAAWGRGDVLPLGAHKKFKGDLK